MPSPSESILAGLLAEQLQVEAEHLDRVEFRHGAGSRQRWRILFEGFTERWGDVKEYMHGATDNQDRTPIERFDSMGYTSLPDCASLPTSVPEML
jgi:hypothetical protein